MYIEDFSNAVDGLLTWIKYMYIEEFSNDVDG